MNCPICNYHQSVEIAREKVENKLFAVYQCNVCDHGYIFPLPSIELISKIASNDHGLNKLGDPNRLQLRINHYNHLFDSRINPNFPIDKRKLLTITDIKGILEEIAGK